MSVLRYWIWLAQLRGVGLKTKHTLLERLGSPENIYLATDTEYSDIGILKGAEISALGNKRLEDARKIAETCQQKNIQIITLQDAQYPARLKTIFDAPLLLYVKGSLPAIDEEAAVAMVGTRKATPYGKRITERLAFGAAKGGAVIVTGLAAGIDTAAAVGALKAGGKVVGVLGCGIDLVYPAWNDRLYRDVELSGALVSEYPPGTSAYSGNFPARNRIISGFSLGVVVIEAPAKSGALITASRALEQGRDVFAVPGNIDAQSFDGSNLLLKDGAIPVTEAWDILREYEPQYQDRISASGIREALGRFDRTAVQNAGNVEIPLNKVIDKSPVVEYKEYKARREELPELNETEKNVLGKLTNEPLDINDIPPSPGMQFSQLMETLTRLKLYGYIKELPGGKFAVIYD